MTISQGGAHYADSMNWAVKRGITAGTGNGRFAPDSTYIRAQIVTFLWKDSREAAGAFLR